MKPGFVAQFMIIKDFPKLHSPFIRKEINGEYVVTPEIDPDYKWVFEDAGVQAVEKLHGSNVSIIIQDGKLIKAYNRLNEKEIWRVDKTWEGLIALLGWLVLARGLIAMWWPDFLRKIAKKLLGGSEFTVAVFLLVVIGLFGVGVGYLGLFHF